VTLTPIKQLSMRIGALETATTDPLEIAGVTSTGAALMTAPTSAAATALLDAFTSGAKGLVPASGGGTANFLRADGTFASPSGSSSLGGAAMLTLPTARLEHEETITAAGVTPSSRVLIALQAGADADENTADMLDLITIAGIPGTDQITVQAQFLGPTRGPILINWSAA